MSKDQAKLPVRRLIREWALQSLYRAEVSNDDDDEVEVESVWAQCAESSGYTLSDREKEKISTQAEVLAANVRSKQAELDEHISKFARNYTIPRMLVVDRLVLRIAAWEMLFAPDIPAVVSVDEAIEVARNFGDDESAKFVNGILDKLMHSLED
jgi:N utilization substance protein B